MGSANTTIPDTRIPDFRRTGSGAGTLLRNGFTLVELVVTLVIASVLAIGVTSYIGDSAAGFATASNSNQLASTGRTAIDRLALELANAVPNSVHAATNNQCLEFIPFTHATTYLDPGFSNTAQQFDVVAFDPDLTLPTPANVYAAIYPLDAAEAYTLASPGPIALVDSITDGDSTDGKVSIQLAAAQIFPRRSPLERLFITTEPVTFCIAGNRLYKYSEYGFQTSTLDCAPACLPPASSGHRSLIADNLAPSPTAFVVNSPTLQRNGIVVLDLHFSSQGTAIQLLHQVLMRNVP